MNTIPAQEIKQRGISAVDPLLERGPVHVIIRNRPKYVIMDAAKYEDWLDDREAALLAKARLVEEDIAAGRYQSFSDEASLRAHIATLFENDEP